MDRKKLFNPINSATVLLKCIFNYNVQTQLYLADTAVPGNLSLTQFSMCTDNDPGILPEKNLCIM